MNRYEVEQMIIKMIKATPVDDKKRLKQLSKSIVDLILLWNEKTNDQT